jgi:hypothetical protein
MIWANELNMINNQKVNIYFNLGGKSASIVKIISAPEILSTKQCKSVSLIGEERGEDACPVFNVSSSKLAIINHNHNLTIFSFFKYGYWCYPVSQ